MTALTARQRAVLDLLGRGLSRRAIAEQLGVLPHAVTATVCCLQKRGLVHRVRRRRAVAVMPPDHDGLGLLRLAARRQREACLDPSGRPDPRAAWSLLDEEDRRAIGAAALALLFDGALGDHPGIAAISDVARPALHGLFESAG